MLHAEDELADIAADVAGGEPVELEQAALARLLTEAEQRERRRLAQLLHDHLQQLLIGAQMHLGMAKDDLDDEALLQPLNRVGELLSESIDATRSLAAELSPPVLHELGLVAALQWLVGWMKEKHGLTITVDADDRAEPTAEIVRVLLFEIVRELLLNVVKHARCDHALIQATRDVDGHVEILVADAGVGYAPTAATPGAQTTDGFGLFSIGQRLKLLDGEMHVDSAPGKGTRVRLRAPITPVGEAGQPAYSTAETAAHDAYRALAPPQTKRKRRRKKAADRRASHVRVLVADDHKMFREGLVILLNRRSDIELVAEADNGQTACELARQHHPDVVVMDVNMPAMDGVEATRRIKAEMPDVRVIGLSLYESERMEATLHEAGADAYLEKSSPVDTLIAAILDEAPITLPPAQPSVT
jgi:CheY-like chemotaxis protein